MGIIESEVYKKYLFHKEMNEIMKSDKMSEGCSTTTNTTIDIEKTELEENKSAVEEWLNSPRNLSESESTVYQDINECKRVSLDEVERIKQKQRDENESYKKDRKNWLAQSIEIEDELSSFKNLDKGRSKNLPCITYDANILLNNILNKSF